MQSRRSVQGFTLIELLIIVAIIGILASVLIPQLLGARAAANKRAIQVHSANVYKVLQAALADQPGGSVSSVVAALSTTDCRAAQTVAGTRFGWEAAPRATAVCDVSWMPGGSDFKVTVTGNGAADDLTSTNGGAPLP